VMDDDEQHLLTNEVDDEPIFAEDLLRVQVLRCSASQRLVLLEESPGAARCVVFHDEYSSMYTRHLYHLTVTGRHQDIGLPGVLFCIPKQRCRVYLCLYPLLTQVLALGCVSPRRPHKWVLKVLPKLEQWLLEVGFQVPPHGSRHLETIMGARPLSVPGHAVPEACVFKSRWYVSEPICYFRLWIGGDLRTTDG